jgi:hypothetical protein
MENETTLQISQWNLFYSYATAPGSSFISTASLAREGSRNHPPILCFVTCLVRNF